MLRKKVKMPSNLPHHRSGAALYYVISGTGANTVDGKTEARGLLLRDSRSASSTAWYSLVSIGCFQRFAMRWRS
jgi:hypothetical protein